MSDTLILSQADTRRLEKLARETGRSTRFMLRHVLRDGFAYTEHFVREVKKGLEDADAGKTVPASQVKAKARQIIENAKRKQAA